MAASTRAITPTRTGSFTTTGNTASSPSPIAQSAGIIAGRDSTTLTPALNSLFHSGLKASPPPQSPKQGFAPRHSAQALSGAAAMAEERRLREQKTNEQARQTSPNPALNAINALLGGGDSGMSKAKDAPPATMQVSEPLAKVAKSIQIPESVTVDNMQTSPVSLSSFGSADSTTAPTATAIEATTAGPLASESMPAPDTVSVHTHSISAVDQAPAELPSPANRAFTFPAPAPPEHDPRAPSRGMSLPMSGYAQSSPKSPTTKRHKCPYCSTDFTRHHNLKSHLLTHSQEKPYECPTCQARFRRLHDLKRHTKLHTGERPHTCPKCGRRFARGDALARHNKGQGGCAGRRASFGIDEDMGEAKGGEESMDGLMYHGEHGEDDKMEEDEQHGDSARRVSEPSRRGHSTRQGSIQGPYHQHPSTYPPVAGRLMGNNARPIYPPGTSSPASSRDQTNISPKGPTSSLSSVHFNTGNSSVFAQGGMTESPKPLSPGQTDPQPRMGISEVGSLPSTYSSSIAQHIHQQFSRGAGRGSSPMGLPPPGGNSNPPQLPSLPGLGPANNRMPMSSNVAGPQQASKNSGHSTSASMLHQQIPAPGQASNPGSLSSHSHTASSGGSMREFIGGREVDMWTYIQQLEARFARTQDDYETKLGRLQDEVSSLKAQLQQYQQQPSR